MTKTAAPKTQCYHCGEDCNDSITSGNHTFCCEGCRQVYGLLNKSSLCDYYNLNENPGVTRRIKVREDKFTFLDDSDIARRLISFTDEKITVVTFYLPQIHCSSCLYLLENLHKIDNAIVAARVNFAAKEATIHFSNKTTLRKVAELCTAIGYEPYISLHNMQKVRPRISTKIISQLGIAGFCFGNIMLASFPEYLGLSASDGSLQFFFRILNVVLSLPVILYCAQPFYSSAFKGLQHGFLNIDAPIVLAVWVTFIRSIYDVSSGTGTGYFDSMTGIVFFMLAGRALQDKTYRQLSFDRDYTAYFPVAVTALRNGLEQTLALPDIIPGDTILIHNEEIIPADGILSRGKAWIDYSFVTGESLPVLKETGEMVYAGGKQTGSNIEVLVIKEAAQSYLTSLWANKKEYAAEKNTHSFANILSRYFTYAVFTIALATGIYWYLYDAAKIWPAVTAVLIIACPCALLLSNTFTNGNILRVLSNHKLYLRNATIIETIAAANCIVFDKTGTLTTAYGQNIMYSGKALSKFQQGVVASLASQSFHPLSRALAQKYKQENILPVKNFAEILGSGISGVVKNEFFAVGSKEFVTGNKNSGVAKETEVYVAQNGMLIGCFSFANQYRKDIDKLLLQLRNRYKLCVLTGDSENERDNLQKLLGNNAVLRFYQKPEDKAGYIKRLQEKGYNVLMVGDGLNDACALKQSNTGIAIADNNNNFTPSCDGIMEASMLYRLHTFIRLCRANKKIVWASFVLSIMYNITGLFFAIQGTLSPLVAAVLMPLSSLSILLVTFGSSNLLARLSSLN